ncbi:MAG TPA: hypothetical protein VHE36_10760 [Sphingomicrobium sp.]|nr:hypothetical protein [Sphingomicrobium sp.]
MHHWTRRLLALAAPLLVTGCLWGPGRFSSDLVLRKDGSFILDYRGEIILETAQSAARQAWQDAMAHCSSDDGKDRPCSAAEITEQKSQFEKKQKDDAEAARAFGLPGSDEASNRAFASKLTKYAGWRSVTYRGKGVYDVDYHFEGRLTQDYVFPLMPDSNIVIPFVALRRRTDGAVLVDAPGLAGGTNMLGPMAQQMGGDTKSSPPSRAEGRFTIHTNGEIVTNNSEEGPAADPVGRRIYWDIAPGSNKSPEALVKL